jgi:cell division protein FtsB
MNERNNRIILPALIFALLVLIWLAVSPWGGVSYFSLHRQLEELRAGNLELADTNRALEREVDRLKNDRAYLEQVAREEYGLLRKNEVIYEYPPNKPAKH